MDLYKLEQYRPITHTFVKITHVNLSKDDALRAKRHFQNGSKYLYRMKKQDGFLLLTFQTFLWKLHEFTGFIIDKTGKQTMDTSELRWFFEKYFSDLNHYQFEMLNKDEIARYKLPL